jgi:hypothetical protein
MVRPRRSSATSRASIEASFGAPDINEKMRAKSSECGTFEEKRF